MGDLKNPSLIIAKGLLFLLTGMLSAAMLIVMYPQLRVAALLLITVWCFCRFYYFAFYVIEHYVDGSYRFAGLGSFLLYLVRRQPPPSESEQ